MKLTLEKLSKNTDKRYSYLHWKTCLPFVENRMGVLIHRPREVVSIRGITIRHGNYLSVHNWCGQSVNGYDKFTFLEAPPDEALLCARCEALAVYNGLPSAESLAGRHVHIGKVIGVKICCEGKP